MYECFRNEDGKLLKTKNGHRFVFVIRPTSLFSEKMEIGNDTSVHISYKGMDKDLEEFKKSAVKDTAPSDEVTKISNTNPPRDNQAEQTAADWKADGATQAQRFIDEFFKQPPPHQQPDDNLSNNTGTQNESGSKQQKQPATPGQDTTSHESFEIDDHSETHDSSVAHDDTAVFEDGATNDSDQTKQIEHQGQKEEIGKCASSSTPRNDSPVPPQRPRGRAPQKTSVTPTITPKTTKRTTPDKKSTFVYKRALTERRRTSSLKRKSESQTSWFDSNSRKIRNKKSDNKHKDNFVSFFKIGNKEADITSLDRVDNSSDEKVLIVKDIICEILSRIPY